MAENVQCPVCTLYLHAGMNLSDHLETHPKEQVIRALVQLTISGGGSGCGQNTAGLASALSGEKGSTGNETKKLNSGKEEKSLPPIAKDNELHITGGINSCSTTSSGNSENNSSLSNQSVSGAQNSNNILNYSTTNNNDKPNEIVCVRRDQSPSSLQAKATVKAEQNSIGKDNSVANKEKINECFSKQSFGQANSSANSTPNTSHSYRSPSVELSNSSTIHNNFAVFNCNQRYEQQQRNAVNNQNQVQTTPHMPPPPPPPSTCQNQVQDINRGILPAGPNSTFHSVQSQQQLPLPSPSAHQIDNTTSSNHRQSHMFVGQHQLPSNSQHQQNLKVIYTPTLPPPPPLQLFTYQPPTHLQHHQKPPPAYGTAISQIRSQHNQNKHQVTGSLVAAQHPHQTLQTHSVLHQQQQQQQQQQVHHLHQQQNLHHNLRIHVPPPPPPPISVPAKQSYLTKNQELPAQHHAATVKHNHQQQHQQQHQNKIDSSQQQQQAVNNESIQNSNNYIVNTSEMSNKSTKGLSATNAITGTCATAVHTVNHAPSPPVAQSPSTASASMTAIAASSTIGRHTNSPFAALLAAAAGAPSPSTSSSVLRYAESPVAHYLERENGDFIVQETPKHIVECVETDNGEFSVIERIYQSPPSVLHIHDDDDDDEEDGKSRSQTDQIEAVNSENADSKNKKQDVSKDNDNDKIKHKTHENHKKVKNMAKGNNTKSNQSDAHKLGNNEIVDFVSISSDSGDEEEFISQEQKDDISTTDSNKEIKSSTTSSPSSSAMQTISSLSMSSSSSIVTASGDDDQSLQSTSNSTLSTSLHSSPTSTATTQATQNTTANSNSSRKKSSKNTITVLSDVQLNLNEYLDLVGNIIASSKVAAQRKTFASIAPIPLVKIEKEEPIDEYVTATSSSNANTNFEIPPPPFKANKHETEEITDNPNSSSSSISRSNIGKNNNNISLVNEINQDEKEEKKPQVFDNITEYEQNDSTLSSFAISNTSTSLMNKNSSQVTSVIRMASTSQQQLQTQQQHILQPTQSLENNKNSTEAEDLSQPQLKCQSMTNSKPLGPTSLARKGPKKLVIKPKSSTKTDVSPTTSENKPNQYINLEDDDQQLPTTSAKAARQEYVKQSPSEDVSIAPVIQVKNEPITSMNYENHQQPQQPYQHPASFSILEQHLSSKEPILEFKEEKPCITEANMPTTTIIKEMKVENNVNDDARVLYDFANSKKSQNDSSPVFPSSMSVFSNKQTSKEIAPNFNEAQKLNKTLNHDMDSSSSSSTYSSQSAMDATMPSEDHNESTATNSSTANGQTQQQTNQVFSDFPFSYLYNNVANSNDQQVDVKNLQQFTTLYQCSSNNNNNNNSGSINNGNNNSALLLEDSSSSKHCNEYQQQNINQQEHPQPSTSQQQQWLFNSTNYVISGQNHSPTNINSLSVDGSPALDGNEVGKYLDLDACKREQNVDMIIGDKRITVPPPPPPSSSTSCSFNGATDNSMAGICSTGATLNIRTDEKMPAKGEISEQESNCDIDNSWSQPMYGDISARFFKTTFPGIFPQDTGWNHDEYFTVQDLSASTTAQATSSNSNRLKSFDPNSNISNNNSRSIPIFSQNSNDNCNIDVMPSTSAKIRKRRKRSSQDGKMAQENTKRMHPTSTVTSQQQMMMQQVNDISNVEFNFQQQPQNLQQQQQQLHHQTHLQQPSTSTAFLAGPSTAICTSMASSFMIPPQQHQSQQQIPQNQSQQKQRTKVYECGHCNAKYSKLKDRNAHMVDVHNYIRQNRRLICPTTGLATPLTNADIQDMALPTTSAASGNLMLSIQNNDCIGDYKQGIVKIENENIQRDLSGVEPISANLSAKTEFIEDDKQQLAIVPLNTGNTLTTNVECDTKPSTTTLPLSMTTPTSKLTTLYRMLVSFNMTTLKQNQNLSEFDENLIKSSIFFCYICRQNFNSVKFYDAHLTEHPAECFTCGKKFQRWKNFSLHLKRHLGWKEFGCTVCDKKFVVRSALVEHTRMHSGLSPLKCKVCGKHFKRYSNLTQHRKRHTKQIVRRKEYVCYCGEVLPSKARFLWHKETHDSKPKCCPHCCDRFVHVNSLRRHIRLAHSDKFDYTEPMECPICKQIFAKASMKAHMATHSTETQYDCAICNKSFSTKWNLKIHSWVHANRTAKPFKCEHCPKAFVREVDFKNHMNSHKQIKPYTCEVCGCKFIRKYNYMRHRREHHGNKKYTCDLCKKSFHRHYYLIEHRRIHTGERPFQCTICGKSSTTKTNHNKHLKIHHSRDPFTVEV